MLTLAAEPEVVRGEGLHGPLSALPVHPLWPRAPGGLLPRGAPASLGQPVRRPQSVGGPRPA